MANVARRAVLKMMGVAPIAAPIAAQEVAAKMGTGTLIGGAHALAKKARYADEACATEISPISTAQRVLNYREDLAFWKSEDRRKVLRSQYRRAQVNLDPDLASLNSVTPAAARAIQIDRLIDEEIGERVSMIEKWIAEALAGK
jgi:hypothetical protein